MDGSGLRGAYRPARGRYASLRRPAVEIATRRFDQEGTLKRSVKWPGIEAHRLVPGEIRGQYLRYFK